MHIMVHIISEEMDRIFRTRDQDHLLREIDTEGYSLPMEFQDNMIEEIQMCTEAVDEYKDSFAPLTDI